MRIYSDNVVLGGSADELRVEAALITVEGTTIKAVAPLPRAELAATVGDDEWVDLADRLVAPAFVNAHTHLALCALRGIETAIADHDNVVEALYFKIERFLLPGDVRAFARMGAYESLLSGVGTVWDHYYHGRQVAEALKDVGMTGVVAPTVQDVDGPGIPYLEPQLEATAEIANDTRLAEAGIVAAVGAHATDTVSSELWTRLRALADEHDLFIHSHVAQSCEEYERSLERHDCSPIERLAREGTLDAGRGLLLVHAMFVTESDLARLDPARHILGHCPFSQTQFDFPTPLKPWLDRGLAITVGTDCAACNDSMSVQKELRLMAGSASFATTHGRAWRHFHEIGTAAEARALWEDRNRSVAATQCLREAPFLLSTIWGVPGRLEPRLPVGELRAGARANLAVWDLDHPSCWPANAPLRTLTMTNSGAALHGLMINGRWTGTPGEHRRSILSSDAYRECHQEAEDRLAAVLRRADISI